VSIIVPLSSNIVVVIQMAVESDSIMELPVSAVSEMNKALLAIFQNEKHVFLVFCCADDGFVKFHLS
jgi:hypothetical protein